MVLNSTAWWPPAIITPTARPASGATSMDAAARTHLGSEHALHVLVAQRPGQRDHHVRGVPREARGVVLVGQPGAQPGSQPGRAEALGENIGVEEVLLHELPESRRELVLALDDHRRVRYGQAQGMTEEGGDGEPVRDAADHGGLGAGLHVTEQRPVDADRGHGHEQGGDRRQERRRPAAGGGQALRPQFQRLALDRGCR